MDYPGIMAQMLAGLVFPSLILNPADQHKVYPIGEKFMNLIQESGYMHIQATKPDTVGSLPDIFFSPSLLFSGPEH